MTAKTAKLKPFPFDITRIENIPFGKLKIDASYQRALNESRANYIGSVNNFNWNAFRTLVVSLRKNGFYYILDGQHRYRGLEIYCESANIDPKTAKLPTVVLTGLNVQQEAIQFKTLNTASKVRGDDLFKCDITGKVPSAIVTADLIREVGLKYTIGGAFAFATINQPGIVRGTYTTFGTDATRNALRVVATCFRDRHDGLKGEYIKGLAMFFANVEIDVEKVEAKLETCEPGECLKRARQAVGRAGWNVYKAIANVTADWCKVKKPFPLIKA